MARTQLYLVRHGEQDPATNHAPDGGLSALGRDQAGRLGRRLAATTTFDAVHHSPLARAAETARILAAHLDATPLHGCDHAVDRTPVPSDQGGYPERWHGWLDSVPDDERDVDAEALRRAVAHLGATGDDDRRDLVVTHAFVIGWFVRHVLDAPEWRWIGLNHANCGLTIVQFDAERPPMLLAYNDTGHL